MLQSNTAMQYFNNIVRYIISTVYCNTLFQRYTAMQSCPLVMHLLLTLHWLLWPRTVLVCGVYMFLFHGMLFGTLYFTLWFVVLHCIRLQCIACGSRWLCISPMHSPTCPNIILSLPALQLCAHQWLSQVKLYT